MVKQFLSGLLFIIALPLVKAQHFYDPATIQKIELRFAASNWDYMLDTAKLGAEGYIMASWVKINGNRIDSVGVKYKGNSSYDSTRLKNPIHIELDAYADTKNYQGYKDLKLSNCYQDPSMVREVLAYNLLSNYMDAPQANFAQVYINGVYMGVYTNVESINKTFCSEHFYGNDGTFIKGNPQVVPTTATKCNLLKLNGDSSSYFNFYEIKSDYGWKQLEILCDSITNKPSSVPVMMDLDRVLWMLAFNNAVINLDSYSGAFCQNYYLYRDGTGRYNPVVWDLNMSFGGFPFLGSSNTSLAALTISNMQNLTPNIHSTDNYWPLIKAIYANPLYKRMYIAHLRTIIKDHFTSGSYITAYNTYKALIDTAVQSDTRKFFSYTQFQNALTANYSVGSYSVPGIQTLMQARSNYLQTTAEFTAASPTIGLTGISNGTPLMNATVSFTSMVNNATSVELRYRYRASEKFEAVTMYDDGLHGDGVSGDNIYGTTFTLKNNKIQYYVFADNASASRFSPEGAEHVFFEYNAIPAPQAGQVVINEFLADNKSDVRNEYHLFEDWIELFNNSNSSLDLSGLYLSNSSGTKAKYSFPNGTSIAPYGFLTVWADDINLPNATQLHAPFKIDKAGDELVLSNGLRTVYDQVVFPAQSEDKSFGRCPDGTGAFKIFTYPSFGMSNCVVGLDEQQEAMKQWVEVYPNPSTDYLIIRTHKKEHLVLTDLLGKPVLEWNVSGTEQFNLSGLKAGVYLLRSDYGTQKLIITAH